MPQKLLSIVIPIYNESDGLPILYPRLLKAIKQIDYRVEIIFVDDGSSDDSAAIINAWIEQNPQISLIQLSRNFGHQKALTAGLDYAHGDVVLTMDGDGQNPPELIPKLLELYEKGNDIVLTQRIEHNRNLPFFKTFTSKVFYSILRRIGDTELVPASADFRLLSRDVVLGLREMREYHRFLRGMVAWMGYTIAILPFEAPDRIAGSSKYSFRKMVNFARDAIFSFSLVPIWFSLALGSLFLVFSIFETIYVVSFWLTGRQHLLEPGWSSLMFVLLFVGGLILIFLGIIGYYVGLVFQEVKKRPLYLIKKIYSKQYTAAEEIYSGNPNRMTN